MRLVLALVLLALPWAARAADEWRIQIPQGHTAKRVAPKLRPEPPAKPLDDDMARALLDYRQYRRVERAMRARLRANPNDAAAWRLLAQALAGEGRQDEAAQARRRARELAGAARVALEISVAAFVDSNLVAAPDTLGLAARDRGDVGIALTLAAAGGEGRLGWHAAFAGRRLQDLRAYDLGRLALGGGLRLGEDVEAGVEWVSMRLGRARLFDEAALYFLRAGRRFELDARLARRWFAPAYARHDGWRVQLRAGVVHRDAQQGHRLRLGLRLGEEHARDRWLGWRTLGLEASLRLGRAHTRRLHLHATLELRPYLAVDPRPFLRTPRRRRDRVLAAGVRLQAPLTRQWEAFLAADIRDQRSNLDARAVWDISQTRSWRRWRLFGGVQWSP